MKFSNFLANNSPLHFTVSSSGGFDKYFMTIEYTDFYYFLLSCSSCCLKHYHDSKICIHFITFRLTSDPRWHLITSSKFQIFFFSLIKMKVTWEWIKKWWNWNSELKNLKLAKDINRDCKKSKYVFINKRTRIHENEIGLFLTNKPFNGYGIWKVPDLFDKYDSIQYFSVLN